MPNSKILTVILWLIVVTGFATQSYGYSRLSGWCEQGNKTITVSGWTSSTSTPVQRSFPRCTVTIYFAGTLSKASLFATAVGTPVSNPVSGDQNGFWAAFIADGIYDVAFSSGGIPVPFTLGSQPSTDPNFESSISGYVPRLKNSKLADILSAKDFGVLCDGTTDDTAALTTAINAAASITSKLMIPSGTCIVSANGSDYVLPIASNVWIQGQGSNTVLKIKAGGGDYKAIFGPYGTLVNNFTLSDMLIDQNTQNNVPPNAGYLNTHFRLVFGTTAGGSNLTARNVHVTNVEGINTFYSGTPNTTIQNCTIDHVLLSVTHDYSALYIATDDAVISSNVIRADTVGSGITAIETHGGKHTIVGNVIDGFITGMNITGVAPTESSGISITGNTVNNAAIGIFIWSFINAGHTTGYGINGLAVTGNTINLTPDASGFSILGGVTVGIGLYPNAGITPLPYRNIMIANNVVTFTPNSTAANTASFGIGYWDATGASNSVSNLTITNNQVINSPLSGIRFSAEGSNINISGNQIVNPGSSSGSVLFTYRNGVFVVSTGQISGLRVTNNLITDNQGTATMAYGIQFLTGNTGDIISSGNVISVTGNAGSLVTAVAPSSSGQHPLINDIVYVPNATSTTQILTAGGVAQNSTILNSVNGYLYTIRHTGTEWNVILRGIAAPTTGTWAIGDQVINDLPVQGSAISGTQTIMGWLCVNAGTPGIWLPYSLTDWDLPQNIGPIDGTSPTAFYIRMAAGGAQGSTVPFVLYGGTHGSTPITYINIDGSIVPQNDHGSAAAIYAGVGSPNGVITAPPGSIYLNASGGGGVSLYVKESGGGNTGWIGK